MTNHFATRMLDDLGDYKNLLERYNSSADISPTSGQMARLLGIAYASKLFRLNPGLAAMTTFSNKGNEIAFGSIGDASTSEGVFFETINAAGVLQAPLLISVWDDGYGISVPKKYQTTKQSISDILSGFQYDAERGGVLIRVVNGWDYPKLCQTYAEVEPLCRNQHIPVLIHVCELTQPQGHSTSGSHERYKTKKRLAWEAEHDCIQKMKQWMLAEKIAPESVFQDIEQEARSKVKQAKETAWAAFNDDIRSIQKPLRVVLDGLAAQHPEVDTVRKTWADTVNPTHLDGVVAAKRALRALRNADLEEKSAILDWLKKTKVIYDDRYHSHLYSQSEKSALRIPEVKPTYGEDAPQLDGREILQACFDQALKRDPRLFAIGEDVGKIGDVNQGFATLQQKYGEWRVTDTGIRENTIVGQGIGAALRGLRPIVEIQYLDYLLYGLQPLSDDLASLRYRTKGGQKAPVIIRTRGHRLEGVWHAGSPMGLILHSLRGIYVLTPRDMTQAAGMYNTMLESDDSAIIIECLNAYRNKEKLPSNIGEFKVPLGQPETLREGTDITIVTYGATSRIVMDAAEDLAGFGIFCEVIDVQTLLPFDLTGSISESIKKTGRVLFADEDVPGGAVSFMMQQTLEVQNAYYYLDSAPASIAAAEHRPAYGSDGNYFSKPNAEDVFDKVYAIMMEAYPNRFPAIY